MGGHFQDLWHKYKDLMMNNPCDSTIVLPPEKAKKCLLVGQLAD